MRNRREEERILLEQKAMYDKSRSSSGGSGNGSDGTTEGVSNGTTEEQSSDGNDSMKD